MRGTRVPNHYSFTMEPREAQALAQVLKDARSQSREGKFALNELEDETAETFIAVVEEGGALVAD